MFDRYGYNNNGATVSSPDGWTYTYDAENHLLTAEKGTNTISYVYDGDGNRVSKTLFDGTNTVITRYLTDSENPTGYVQVVEELNGAYGVQKRYVYGLDLISQTEVATGNTYYYGYDGTGSTRLLVDALGNITDTYDYDAFGTVIYQTGTTDNEYLFHGEQYDSDLGLYYLRARYMNGGIGRFWSMDEWEGDNEDPMSLHKYVFVANNPINLIDPEGKQYYLGMAAAMGVMTVFITSCASMPKVLVGDILESRGRFINPTGGVIRGCDRWGCGYYKAYRTSDPIKGHHGIDITSKHGQDIVSPIKGTIEKTEGVEINEGVRITGKFGRALFCVRLLHINPVKSKGYVNAGDKIGTAKDLTKKWPGIINHIHIELYDVTRGTPEELNPTSYIFQ